MTDRIFAPNLYLCAYHLKKDGTEGEIHPLWENCDRFLSHLTDTQLIPHLDINTENRILLKNNTEITFTLTDSPDIEGFIQPVQLPDSYGVFLNIGYDDSDTTNTNIVESSVLNKFNPDQILPFLHSQHFLGQTLLLTLFLTPDDQDLKGPELTDLANQCYQTLLNQETAPYRRSELFGSPLFEYGNPRHPDESPHVLIWLFRDEVADETLQKCFGSTFDLFFYRHKVTKAFQDSREIYGQLKQYYHSLDPTLDQIQTQIDNANPDPQNAAYLQDLKIQLKHLSSDSLIYDRLLRKMKDFLTTIAINCNNYNDKIDEICAKLGVDKEELSLWRHFGEQTAPQFQHQIKADLSYFDQGTGLISQAIASIRAIVEIDQAQCDRQWMRWEKKREKRQQERLKKAEDDAKAEQKRQEQANQKLQDQIQAVGVGIATGAIIASTAPLIFQKPITWPRLDKNWHPFTVAVLLSVGCALVAWWVAQGLIRWGRNK